MLPTQEISVIVQGAIDTKYTSKCLQSIRQYLPQAEIILSTWEGANVDDLNYDILILNKDPGTMLNIIYPYPIYNNVNRQLVSTQQGILKATRKYILKLRSDLVLKNADFLNYWENFPKQNKDFTIFKHRVISGSTYTIEYLTNSNKPTPFNVSDFWFFGLTEDIKDYFLDCPLQTKEESENWKFKYPNKIPDPNTLWRFPPEQVFCFNWVKKYFPNAKFDDWSDWNIENIELSNNIIYNNFIILDLKQSGIYCKKHGKHQSSIKYMLGIINFEYFQNSYEKYCNPDYQHIAEIKNEEYYIKKLRKEYYDLKKLLKYSIFTKFISITIYLIKIAYFKLFSTKK